MDKLMPHQDLPVRASTKVIRAQQNAAIGPRRNSPHLQIHNLSGFVDYFPLQKGNTPNTPALKAYSYHSRTDGGTNRKDTSCVSDKQSGSEDFCHRIVLYNSWFVVNISNMKTPKLMQPEQRRTQTSF